MSRLLIWLFFATLSLILLLQLRGIDAPLAAVTPGGIVAFELAFTGARAREILDSWRIAGVTESARVSLGVDVGFLLVYPWFFRWSVQLLRQPRFTHPGSTMDRAGAALGAAVLACTPLDAAENWALWRMIRAGGRRRLAQVPAHCRHHRLVPHRAVTAPALLFLRSLSWLTAPASAASPPARSPRWCWCLPPTTPSG
jgi:hypothetical protein